MGEHKTLCGTMGKTTPGNQKHNYLLAEFDLVTEPEDIADSNETETEDDEARRVKDYEAFLEKHKENAPDDLADVPDEEFEKYTGQIDDDKDFHKFKKRTNNDPDQVIRFDRGGTPLWITNKNQPKDDDIPVCEACKSPRLFEFQVSYYLHTRPNTNE